MDAAFEYEYRSADYEYEAITARTAALADGWPRLERFAKLRFAHTALAIKVDRRSTEASPWSSPGHPAEPHANLPSDCQRALVCFVLYMRAWGYRLLTSQKAKSSSNW